MHPVLFKIGPFELRAYGVMLALSFLFGIWLAVKRAKTRDVNPDRIMDLAVIILVSSIVGSRLMYVMFHLDEFRGRWLDTINPFQSDGQIGLAGLTLLGGVLLSFAGAFLYLRRHRLNFFRFADVIMPSVGLGIFLTRIGCFLNGCCFGLPCENGHGLCVVFPAHSPAGEVFPGLPLIPAQLYSSLYGLIIFIVLLTMDRRKYFDGFLFFLFLILYGIARFAIDLIRYYEETMVWFTCAGKDLSMNQAISLAFVVAGAIGLIMGLRKKRQESH
ncbi:prolipoprotein diacylglyceryl transferase [candidate division KSB1 bacterium]|nr:prolipoprotein diacylglyceryl transferase [candidate division KSB1 bacterium]